MGQIRTGTTGYQYRDWMGVFYPTGSPLRRQLQIYSQNFDVCELPQFEHQMPDRDWVAGLARQLKTGLGFFVRIHQSMTHHQDAALAINLARHFKHAMEPLHESGRLLGFVAQFPYSFRESGATREYLERLGEALKLPQVGLHVDLKHPSWANEKTFVWLAGQKLGFVCVDEPVFPSSDRTLVVATSDKVLVRLHGRNRDDWWSGAAHRRFDYCYSLDEITALLRRYQALAESPREVCFVFQNYCHAQSVKNALQWKIIAEATGWAKPTPAPAGEWAHPQNTWSFAEGNLASSEDEHPRPSMSLPMDQLKQRVNRVLADIPVSTPEQLERARQIALTLPPRR
jgi:uncharacterized protein YecE (DUF72 family)